jgi:leucyl aminopeptidase (aminopeptidase T)
MFPIDQFNIIKLIVNTSLAIKPGESVLIIAATDEDVEIASLLAAEIKSVGAEVAITIIDPRRNVYHEPPKFVAESMKHANVVIGVIYTLFYTRAKEVAQSAGARFATMVGEKKEDLANLDFDKEDLDLIVDRGRRIAEMVSRAKTAKVTSHQGTNLTISLLDRKGIAIIPICRDPGTGCSIPDYSEVACATVEEGAEGTLVIDGTMVVPPWLERVVKEPITLKIKRGKIAELSGGEDAEDLEAILASAESNGKLLGELGIGANHKVNKFKGSRRDMSKLGTIHIGFGKNDMLGGKIATKTHFDLMVTKPTLALDDFLLIERGKLNL